MILVIIVGYIVYENNQGVYGQNMVLLKIVFISISTMAAKYNQRFNPIVIYDDDVRIL